ncbi:hypothetical protein BKA69DRAFT_1093076 [Paraphysoderma sedebokerense]|nr:hypothetical protein BKA69DRAFT_1098215 [Paraphysoderma sedebokerense]KAI9138258.1 hypothetical protein BKA69DRAFT_1093076 [Paraphysoderma sedebokerense]
MDKKGPPFSSEDHLYASSGQLSTELPIYSTLPPHHASPNSYQVDKDGLHSTEDAMHVHTQRPAARFLCFPPLTASKLSPPKHTGPIGGTIFVTTNIFLRLFETIADFFIVFTFFTNPCLQSFLKAWKVTWTIYTILTGFLVGLVYDTSVILYASRYRHVGWGLWDITLKLKELLERTTIGKFQVIYFLVLVMRDFVKLVCLVLLSSTGSVPTWFEIIRITVSGLSVCNLFALYTLKMGVFLVCTIVGMPYKRYLENRWFTFARVLLFLGSLALILSFPVTYIPRRIAEDSQSTTESIVPSQLQTAAGTYGLESIGHVSSTPGERQTSGLPSVTSASRNTYTGKLHNMFGSIAGIRCPNNSSNPNPIISYPKYTCLTNDYFTPGGRHWTYEDDCNFSFSVEICGTQFTLVIEEGDTDYIWDTTRQTRTGTDTVDVGFVCSDTDVGLTSAAIVGSRSTCRTRKGLGAAQISPSLPGFNPARPPSSPVPQQPEGPPFNERDLLSPLVLFNFKMPTECKARS